ncbi:MAG: caspase family protein [Myxococcota bacterium]
MASKGLSIHIGLNHVDPAAYNGWDGALSGCINDATDMKAIAESLGYSAQSFIDSDATSDNVVAALGKAASDLESGDILFLTYSGHGGQTADVNGDEEDGQDETWVLWDRQLIDDELYALWSQFKEGVRIVMLSDSCHSGTVARLVAAYAELGAARKDGPSSDNALREALATLIPQRESPRRPGARPGPPPEPDPKLVKLMPSDVRAVVNSKNRKSDATRQYLAGASERAALGASIILISGCQDNQTSLDGAGNGLFTEKLKAVWNGGLFTGTYREFADAIIAEMPANQRPNYYTVGAVNAAFEAQAPFRVEAPRSAATGDPKSVPTQGPSVPPTLRRGDSGTFVKMLQDRLAGLSYNVELDSSFGPRTETAVRSFQATRQLEPSGVVDRRTWEAVAP